MKMELATIMNAMLRPDDIVAINKRVQQKKVSGCVYSFLLNTMALVWYVCYQRI